MKLKRLLLRYNPPGIGLEVEDDEGVLEVRHKSLLATKEVASELDILALAEEVCASEPDLLNARKHRGSLLQLLGRLYRVEAFGRHGSGPNEASTPETKDVASSSTSPGEDSGPIEASQGVGSPIIEEGSRVVIVGLRGKMVGYNGQVASVLKVKEGRDKYEVAIEPSHSDERSHVLKIKGADHLLSLIPAPPLQPLAIDTCVVLSNLRNHTELNGNIGRVVDSQASEESPDSKRGKAMVEVRIFETDQLFRVKRENVVPVEASERACFSGKENREPNMATDSPCATPDSALPQTSAVGSSNSLELLDPGCVIEIVGLRSNMAFNGEQAKIVSVDRDALRYEVKMNDDSVRKLKVVNARLVAFAPAAPMPTLSPNPGAGGLFPMMARGTCGTSASAPVLRYGDRDMGKRKANELEKLVHTFSPEPGQLLRSGCTVLLNGLKTAPHLNGAFAVVTQDLGDRAEIQLEDGSLKKVRKEFVEIVTGVAVG